MEGLEERKMIYKLVKQMQLKYNYMNGNQMKELKIKTIISDIKYREYIKDTIRNDKIRKNKNKNPLIV